MTDERFGEIAAIFRLTPLQQQAYVRAYHDGHVVERGWPNKVAGAYEAFCVEAKRPYLSLRRAGHRSVVTVRMGTTANDLTDAARERLVSVLASLGARPASATSDREFRLSIPRRGGVVALWVAWRHVNWPGAQVPRQEQGWREIPPGNSGGGCSARAQRFQPPSPG